jgi:hypothetical protein
MNCDCVDNELVQSVISSVISQFQVLYTQQKSKKAKVWQDGTLKVDGLMQKVNMLLNYCLKNSSFSTYWRTMNDERNTHIAIALLDCCVFHAEVVLAPINC